MQVIWILLLAACTMAFSSMSAAALPEWASSPPPGPFAHPSKERPVRIYSADEPVVGTFFFYWYDVYSKAHFVNGDGSDAMVDHPADTKDYSYRSSAWWKREMQDVRAAGIDFITPVYWGYPGDDGWSIQGLPPMVEAWDQLRREGSVTPPQIGLFYDTSTLRHNRYNYHCDLRSEEGKLWFYLSVRDFFSCVPRRCWATVEGRPIIIFYSPHFAAGLDPDAWPYLRQRFRKDFGVDPYLVKATGFPGETDAVYSWGGALAPKIYSVISIGPGYDHHAVPGRKPLVVDREGGRFYQRAWEQVLSLNPKRRGRILMVETWNELHEGTDICATREYGRQYIELTRKYADQFRAGDWLRPQGPFRGAKQVEWSPDRSHGLSLVPDAADGTAALKTVKGVRVAVTRPNRHNDGRYLYFAVDDSFLFDADVPSVTVEIRFLDAVRGKWAVEYDNVDPKLSIREGAFRQGSVQSCKGTGEWKTVRVSLLQPRFANRCNGADFRIALLDGFGADHPFAVASVRVLR